MIRLLREGSQERTRKHNSKLFKHKGMEKSSMQDPGNWNWMLFKCKTKKSWRQDHECLEQSTSQAGYTQCEDIWVI